MNALSLSFRHILLALAVVAVWGTNFVVIKMALADLPPLLFATLRFLFVLLPAVFFLPRPKASWRNLAGYGLFIGAGQFGLLYIAIRASISPGLASLVIQTQVFITIGLSMLFARDHVKAYQILALLIAMSGIVLIGIHADKFTTPIGLCLTLGAAFSWACGNVINKQAGKINMLSYVVWASLFSFPALAVLSCMFEGWPTIKSGLTGMHVTTWLAVLWQSIGNTMFGYVAWGWLLARYSAAVVTPMALLVPVFGMGASGYFLHETLPAWKMVAATLVLSGLALNILWPQISKKLAAK